MSGYGGFTDFIFETNRGRATLMFSGREDPDYPDAATTSFLPFFNIRCSRDDWATALAVLFALYVSAPFR
jgi:hypothetical protein